MVNSIKIFYLSCFVVLLGCETKNAPLSGKLSFVKDTLYIKTKSKGVTDTFQVYCSNAGKAALKIINAEGSCGCTAIQFDSLDILPNESKKLTITYKHNGDTTASFLKNIVFLNSGTPKFKVFYLKTYN